MAPAGSDAAALILAKSTGLRCATARTLASWDLADQRQSVAKLGNEESCPVSGDQKDDAAVKAFVEDVTARKVRSTCSLLAFQGLVAMTRS